MDRLLGGPAVESPSPAFKGCQVPLASTYVLSSKPGEEQYLKPIVNGNEYSFELRRGAGNGFDDAKRGSSAGKRAGFRCLLSGDSISYEYIRSQFQSKSQSFRLLALCTLSNGKRTYREATVEQEMLALQVIPEWEPLVEFFPDALGFRVANYGIKNWAELFTPRQLNTLAISTQAITEIATKAEEYYIENPPCNQSPRLAVEMAQRYSSFIATTIAFAISKHAMYSNTITPWYPKENRPSMAFTQQVISMVWDFVEVYPFSGIGGSLQKSVEIVAGSFEGLVADRKPGVVELKPAQDISEDKPVIFCTDPPYYDNVDYADLSDFFYVWLRRSLANIRPDFFRTFVAPKSEELVATPARHGGSQAAEDFFLSQMKTVFSKMRVYQHDSYPMVIYYAYKQSETSGSPRTGGIKRSSTGWETFLQALVDSGLEITATWPIRTERAGRQRGSGSNALASSLVIACRARSEHADKSTRAAFKRSLRDRLLPLIALLKQSSLPASDFAQASIGPAMSIFSSYQSVINPDDTQMSVREALTEINHALDECLSEDESNFDADTRFAVTFFESYAFEERDYGDAESLAKARNVSVAGVAESGILRSVAGKVRLLRRSELEEGWDPAIDKRLCTWEATQYLIRNLEDGGEFAAAALLSRLIHASKDSGLVPNCRALAYRLYNYCESTKQTEEALAYNSLVIAWPELERLAASQSTDTAVQASLI
jgi:putative DNA methylase